MSNSASAQDGPDDEQLVLQAQAGSRSAFEALVRRYQKPVYYLCLRYVREHDAAADLVQRSFIRAYERVTSLREAVTFKSWLFKIAANFSLNHLRDHARFVDESDVDPVRTASPAEAIARLEADEEQAALRVAVACLPTKQRMTLELRIYEDLSFKEIAEALGTNEGAAKVNFHYAVRKLRAHLAPASTGKAESR